MKVNDPLLITNPVRADSEEAKNGFYYVDPDDGTTDYFLPLAENEHFDFHFTDSGRRGSEHLYVAVLNLKEDCIGIVPADRMVEPVELEVIVKEKE